MAFDLHPLPYAADALAPYMSARHVEIHYGKHHATYVKNLNELTHGSPLEALSLEALIKESAGKPEKAGLFNNSAQVWNHDFFWQSMKPHGGGTMPAGLEKKIIEDFGSVEAFREAFIKGGTTQFGSGWVWLVLNPANGKLEIVKTGNADTPLVHGLTPLLTCDVWEHAYYLDYENRRVDFLKVFLDHLVNWEFAASRLVS